MWRSVQHGVGVFLVIALWLCSRVVCSLDPVDAGEERRLSEGVFFTYHSRSGALDPMEMTAGKFREYYMVVHGLDGWSDDDFNLQMRSAILNATNSLVISVDWSAGARHVSYEQAILNMNSSADGIATRLLHAMEDRGVSFSQLKFVGFSLGAQMGGYVSRRLPNNTRLPYIIALDPAGLYFEGEPFSIGRDAADYVEVIHTCTGLALIQPVGHNDFYPNKGQLMPGCTGPGTTFMQQEFCSHSRAYEYYAETLRDNNFIGVQCENYEEMFNGSCSRRSQLRMGGLEPKPPRGVFYLETNPRAPFLKQ